MVDGACKISSINQSINHIKKNINRTFILALIIINMSPPPLPTTTTHISLPSLSPFQTSFLTTIQNSFLLEHSNLFNICPIKTRMSTEKEEGTENINNMTWSFGGRALVEKSSSALTGGLESRPMALACPVKCFYRVFIQNAFSGKPGLSYTPFFIGLLVL